MLKVTNGRSKEHGQEELEMHVTGSRSVDGKIIYSMLINHKIFSLSRHFSFGGSSCIQVNTVTLAWEELVWSYPQCWNCCVIM